VIQKRSTYETEATYHAPRWESSDAGIRLAAGAALDVPYNCRSARISGSARLVCHVLTIGVEEDEDWEVDLIASSPLLIAALQLILAKV
jgi:hypothetical protein